MLWFYVFLHMQSQAGLKVYVEEAGIEQEYTTKFWTDLFPINSSSNFEVEG